jgi:hypothetical protein
MIITTRENPVVQGGIRVTLGTSYILHKQNSEHDGDERREVGLFGNYITENAMISTN